MMTQFFPLPFDDDDIFYEVYFLRYRVGAISVYDFLKPVTL